ncbi:MAG TPA: extracellular solute-binding protein [Firmicutes bacterium]|nr:extracellular solute-binding protein [Bacillota bacterium]
MDLDPLVSVDPTVSWSYFIPVSVEGAAIPFDEPNGGMRWILPDSFQVIGAGFNHDKFSAAGLVPPSMWNRQWTWNDLVDLGRKLVRIGADGRVEQYAAQVVTTWSRWPVWVHNAGGWYFDRLINPRESRLNTAPVTQALQFLQDIFQKDRFAHSGSVADFRSGKAPIGLAVGPSHTALHISMGNTWEYSFGPNPALVNGGSELSIFGRSIGATTKHVNEAWRWIKYLTVETVVDNMRMTSALPALIAAAQKYQETVANASPWDRVWPELLQRQDSYLRPVYSVEIRDTLQQYINAIVSGQKPVGIGLAEAHEQISAMLKEKWSGVK